MLIITNGDSAAEAIKHAGIKAEILPWRDVLHDGPVPSGLNFAEMASVRARFIAGCGWGEYTAVLKMFQHQYEKLESFTRFEELVLWFEHDLYDQLQLIQILDFLADSEKKQTKMSLICKNRFVTDGYPQDLKSDFKKRQDILDAQLKFAKKAWEAFTSANPDHLHPFLSDNNSELPFFPGAVLRILQEYPNRENGLSRNERQILEIVNSGIHLPARIFRTSQKYEKPLYLGDWSSRRYISQMVNCENPLLKTETGEPFTFPPKEGNRNDFLMQKLFLTKSGQQVLKGEKNWVLLNRIDKWLGGVHLTPENLWWWDEKNKLLVREL